MNFYSETYGKNVSSNERNLTQWIAYKDKLEKLNLEEFSQNLTVPVLVPVGSRILFRGEIIHTNEVTVALGANYFAKCNIKQAQEIQKHRIAVSEEKIKDYEKESNYLEQHLEFTKHNVFDSSGEEIIEPYIEDEEKKWREKHRESERKYRKEQSTVKGPNISDSELWEKLEELELKEEMDELIERENKLNQNEAQNNVIESNVQVDQNNDKTREELIQEKLREEQAKELQEKLEKSRKIQEIVQEIGEIDNETNKELDMAQIMKRRIQVEARLNQIGSIDKTCKTQEEIIQRLDQLEEQEELQDELDRLDDLAESIAYHQEEESEDDQMSSKFKRSVSFADNSDSECIEIEFKHSENSADTSHYNKANGINKPSDIYSAFPECFEGRKKVIQSILKKNNKTERSISYEESSSTNNEGASSTVEESIESVNLLGDIVEHNISNTTLSEEPSKKISKFKQMRMQRFSKNDPKS